MSVVLRTRGVPRPVPLLSDLTADRVYRAKWARDLDTGFVSHLSGEGSERIVFNESRRPERILEEVRAKAKRAKISLCMIVKNEEPRIRACLESVLPFLTQIVVVDTGSSDRTPEIARECGAEVYIHPWQDSFSVARNHSLSYATGDFIFWLDADDVLPFAMGEALLDVALRAPKEDVAYTCAVRFVDQGGGGATVDHVKLFRNRVGAKFIFRIHENVLPSLREAGGNVVKTGLYVLHANQDTSPEAVARKRELHYKLLMMDLKEQGEHSFILFNLGMTDFFNGCHERSLDWFERSIAAGEPGESQTRKCYALWSAAYRKLNRFEDALGIALRGLAMVGEDPELRSQAGCPLIDLGRYEEAKQQLLLMKPDALSNHFTSLDPVIFGPHHDHHMALACLGLNDYVGARSWLLRALEARSLYMPSVQELWRIAEANGDFETMRRVMSVIEQITSHSEMWVEFGFRYASALESYARNADFLQRALSTDPRSKTIRLAYARLLYEAKREDEALYHFAILGNDGVAIGADSAAVILAKHGRYQKAESYQRLACKLAPDNDFISDQLDKLTSLFQLTH